MRSAEQLQQRLLKARRTRVPLQILPSHTPCPRASPPSSQHPSNSQTPSSWVSPNSNTHQRHRVHTLNAGAHHKVFVATAVQPPQLVVSPTRPRLHHQSDQDTLHDSVQPGHADELIFDALYECPLDDGTWELSSDAPHLITRHPCTAEAAREASSISGSSLGASHISPFALDGLDEEWAVQSHDSSSRAELNLPVHDHDDVLGSGSDIGWPRRPHSAVSSYDDLDELPLAGKPRTWAVPNTSGQNRSGRRLLPPSPDHVAALARVFRLTEDKAQELASVRPVLQLYSEEHIVQRAKDVTELLQTREVQALMAIRKQPFLLQEDISTLKERLSQLQQQLGLDLQVTCRLCANAPSVLRRPADKLGERFERIAASLAMTKAQVVDMAGRCRTTQFLTERSNKLHQRFLALAETLHLDVEQAALVVRRQPDILFMSTRILANKVRVLQAVFGTKHRQVTPIVAKCPELLRRDMDSIRRIVCMLQVMLNVTPDFVYKMMVHNARLLSMNFQSTQWKAQQLKYATSSCSCWAAQWHSMLPRHTEHCLAATQRTYLRLDYIMQTGQQEKIQLLDALRLPLAKFEAAFPEYAAWLQQYKLRLQQSS